MAFELKANESVNDGIIRNVRHQIETALQHLGATTSSRQRGESETEAVGEVRKCFKRVRAALRLARAELSEDRYHEENWGFRDAARPLTQVRDAGILVETAEKLRQQFPTAMGSKTFRKIHEALVANQRKTTCRVLDDDRAIATVADAATRALARLPDWKLEGDGWAALETGLRRVYRTGHRALASATESASVGNLHEWRKQTKYLWHSLQLVEPALTASEKALVDKTHTLSTLLGEDHDLAVLRETLAADPLAYGGHRMLKGVFVIIDRRRQDLEQQAFALGGEIYKDPPRLFTSRLKASMSYEDAKQECRRH
jgi:CHAD domain-containing protein